MDGAQVNTDTLDHQQCWCMVGGRSDWVEAGL